MPHSDNVLRNLRVLKLVSFQAVFDNIKTEVVFFMCGS